MRIAVIGAGFAGLSTIWYLLHHSQGGVSIDLYDSLALGEGTSGLSSGLLHLYAGKHAFKAKEGEKKLASVNQLFSESARAIGQPIVLSKGILRPAVTPEQINDFRKCAIAASQDCEWWDKEKCESKVQGLKIPRLGGGGLFIKSGITIDVETYLEGLWKAVALFGVQFHQKKIQNESELQKYDRVVFALGAGITKLKPFYSLPVESIKGQALVLKWPKSLQSLPFSLISEGYLTMGKDLATCVAGATFEREFSSEEPDAEVALAQIRKKIVPFFPEIENFELVQVKAGVRAANKHTHQPLVGRMTERFWFITGLGSKGLLNHGYLGDLLAQAILGNDSGVLPKELRYGL